MLKKMLCLLLAVLLCPAALAEDSGAGMLSYRELADWAAPFIARARDSQTLNNPADSLTADGYEYIYDFATLYADTPAMSPDTIVSAVVLSDASENGPRHVNVGCAMSVVLDGFYTENPELAGSDEAAVLYAVDLLPEAAYWGQVNRDGQRVQTIQYAVHEQMASGSDGYCDAGVIYTMLDNRVSAVRVYGLENRIPLETVNRTMYTLLVTGLDKSYVQVPFSYDGGALAVFGEEDLAFSGLNLLTLTPESAISLLGEPMSDTWMNNGDAGYIRVQAFAGCEVTYLFNKARTEGRVYMLRIAEDGLEGPRGLRIGDSFSSVYNRFRNGEGDFLDEMTEMLYGEEGGAFGKAEYGYNADATLIYAFPLADGRRVTLEMSFAVMELAELMLFVD